MGTKDPRIDAYIEKSAEFARPILKKLRALVHKGCPAPGVTETIKWGMPAFEYKGPFCGMAAFKNHCTFGFWKDKLLRTDDAAARALDALGRIESVDDLLRRAIHPKTLGSDRGLDSGPYMVELESRGVTPHTAMLKTSRNPKTVRHHQRPAYEARRRMRRRLKSLAYAISQRARKKVDEVFGWMKTIAGLARSRHVGRWKLRQQVELAAATYNLVRMRKLLSV